ncbi:hypothetical protein N8T08_009389 [Aspergillus melleus]|uniref:Uncharacterized protein n=1 Tax=Aspergillus melleus TaxID=138277 RepID=A0ACC3ATX3_9EURO|nr:hypothetical protein N8T08_009389 [Aspergillus melleus]
MNPATYNNGGGALGGAKAHGQMQAPQKNDNNSQAMMNYVAQALQSQGPFTGWRAEVPVKDRAVKVYQMLTSLRLIQPRVDLQNATQAALSFEQKAFKEAREKVDYDKECNEKLIHIRDTRARQAAVMQNGMMPQGGPGAGMPGVGQSPFPQQMNRQVQASPMAGQQQMAMNMNDPTQQVSMQSRQPSQSQPQQQAMLQQQQQQQRQQQRPNGSTSLTDDLNSLSAQEFDHVCRIADQIITKTSPEDIEKIKMNLQNMTPEQKTYLLRKDIDPVTYFFRSQALTQLRRHKRHRMELNRAQNAGVDPAAMMNDPMVNNQQRQALQNMMNLQRNSAFPMANNQQHLDTSSFIGNVENIQGQQADGLRSQEAGQLVVPASSSQMNQQPFNPQNMFQVGQQLGQGGQSNMNGGGMNPQQFFSQQQLQNSQAVQPDRNQQAPQFSPQTQAQTQAQARAQAAQKAQIAISQAGQANPHVQQQMSQQNSAMPMLNRPMAPGQMSPAQVAAQVRPPSRTPGMGQQPNGVQPLGGQPTMQGRPQLPANLPQGLQEHLSQMTPEQINNFLNQQRRAQAMARAGATQQGMPMQPNMSQPGQGQQQMTNGQMGNNQNMRASLNLQQQLAGMGGAQPQPNQMMPGQQMSVQQRQQQQQRQQELYKLQLLRQQSGSLEMSPDQVKEMDRAPFPPAILSNNPNMVSPVPKHIKTWGQLKQWAAANQQVLGGIDLQKLMTMQKFHLAQIMAQSQNKEGGRNQSQGGQGAWMPPVPFQGQPQPFGNPQPFPAGQQQAAANVPPPIRPVTAQDVQMARQRLGGQVAAFNDDQLRELLHRNRQKQVIQIAQARALATQQGQQQGQQVQQGQPNQPAQQPPVTAPMSTPQIKQEPQAPQATSQPAQPAQPIKAPTAASGKGAKGPVAKPPPKRKMQQEEPTEPQNPAAAQTSTQPPAPQGVAAPASARPNVPLTREQLAAMTPQQRAQLEAHVRRQQGQGRVPITRVAAEEAWNNLPEKIRQLYNEAARQAPLAEPVAITPEQKAAMTQQLRECTDMLGRMDALVQWFMKVPGQEKCVRSLLVMRIQLMRQFKSGPHWAVADHFTLTPDNLTKSINYVKRLFQGMITHVSQQQRSGASQSPLNGQAAAPNMPALNANNLQQLQQEQEALQRARRASSQTAVSATSAVPPAPFGAPSPQGVPHAYGPGSIPPQELKLPPPKKRKQSHAGATPTTGTAGTKAAAGKQAGTEAAKPTPAALSGPFKCSVAECQYHYHGFLNQIALDKHVEESHKVEESIEDPLGFALESFRTSLVTTEDKSGAQGARKGATMEAPQIPKLEGTTPITAGTTPMGRVPSQFGPKTASPASNQHLTPRGGSTKTSASTAKPAKGKDDKKDPIKPAEQEPPVQMQDPWATSAISLETIHDTFLDLSDDGGLGFGAMDEFLNPDMFTNTQSKDTPDSVETAVVTQTPKDSDMPTTDDMNAKSGEGADDNWIPVDWFNLPGRFEDGLLMNDSWEEIDWDTFDRKDTSMNVDDSGIAICAM